jgi:drug/metabolite transporter (DMT)-like permease
MRIFFLTAFTMIAFASNSLLTRLAVEPDYIDAVSFALIRVLSGAAFMAALVARAGAPLPWRARARAIGALSLTAYMFGFSLAYITLDAGLGALILFGVVQITMFGYSSMTGARPTWRQLSGAAIAFCGLVLALMPAPSSAGSGLGAAFMVVAGVGWAIYTLSGRSSRNPLATTAANFVICAPVTLVLSLPFLSHATPTGIAIAVVCGALTSGLGYALWYRVLPDLQQNVAPVVQLSVPVIAIFAGAVLLGEEVTAPVVLAAVLVIAGIALAVTRRSPQADRR